MFINTALKKLDSVKKAERDKILATIHAFEISDSQMAQELKFLTCWIALERLANDYYGVYKSKKRLFSKTELRDLKSDLAKALERRLKSDSRLRLVKDSITRNFIYEHNTFEKMMLYFDYLDLGFDNRKLARMLRRLLEIRVTLVHNLTSNTLNKTPFLFFYLQMIMENTIFRLLGVDKTIQNQFLLNQYNLGTEL